MGKSLRVFTASMPRVFFFCILSMYFFFHPQCRDIMNLRFTGYVSHEPDEGHPLMLRNREINLFYAGYVAQFVGRVTVTCPTLSEKLLKYFSI